jgi:hypothetical protein
MLASGSISVRPKPRWSSSSTRSRRFKPCPGPSRRSEIMLGTPERWTHDYVRHGSTSLFRGVQPGRRHRDLQPPPPPPHPRVPEFLVKIDAQDPEYSGSTWSATTAAPTRPDGHRLAAAPSPLPDALHPTYPSWINQVERFFAPSPMTCSARRASQSPGPRSRRPQLDQDLNREVSVLHLDQVRRTGSRVTRAISTTDC